MLLDLRCCRILTGSRSVAAVVTDVESILRQFSLASRDLWNYSTCLLQNLQLEALFWPRQAVLQWEGALSGSDVPDPPGRRSHMRCGGK